MEADSADRSITPAKASCLAYEVNMEQHAECWIWGYSPQAKRLIVAEKQAPQVGAEKGTSLDAVSNMNVQCHGGEQAQGA
jgi:hypothetical protein